MVAISLDTIKNKGGIKILAFVSILTLVVILLVLLFGPSKDYVEKRLFQTGLTRKSDFAFLDGYDLYAYNGLAFYTVDLNDNRISVLSSGTKLPSPKDIYWGNDNGALLNFESSYLLTNVERFLERRDQSLNAANRNYTWYFDFSDNSLSLVNELPVKDGLSMFSHEDNGFYYIPDYSQFMHLEDSPVSADRTPLHFFDVDDTEDTVLSNDLRLADVRSIAKCPVSELGVCLIARDSHDITKEKLYAIGQDGQKELVLATDGRMFATNRPNLFVTVGGNEDAVDSRTFLEADEEPAILHNIHDGTAVNLGFKVGNSDLIVHIENEEEFYILESPLLREGRADDERYLYREGSITSFDRGKTSLHPLLLSSEDGFKSEIINIVSHGQNMVLVTTLDQSQMLFAPKTKGVEFDLVDEDSAKMAVDECADSFAKENDYFSQERLFRIFFTDDREFQRNIGLFSDCLVNSSPAPIKGYNYYFGGLDSVNGRLVTD